MKNNRTIIYILTVTLTGAAAISCKDTFLDQPPLGAYDQNSLNNLKGVEGMLINAYATLDGPQGSWYTGATNWVWGSVLGGESYKGSEATDQTDLNPIERYEVQPSNLPVVFKWNATYDGIGQANQVLKSLKGLQGVPAEVSHRIEAEARFLRAHHHFEGKKVFENIPFVDETVTDFLIPNNVDAWPDIVEDLLFAYGNLPETQPQAGRVNKWAAGAYLAKAYLFQGKYTEAKSLLEAIIASGKNNKGEKYGLVDNYSDLFRVGTENSKESIFAVQLSALDGTQTNGGYDGTLNYPHGAGSKPGGCCGFASPTQYFVNAFKTDAVTGLPLMDAFNASDVTSDEKVTSNQDFIPYAGSLDPRLDWSVGRRGIPYYDWGLHPGRDWIRDVGHGGPYSPKKNTYYKADEGKMAEKTGWGWTNNALNYTIIRYSDVLLWAAECEVEVGSLNKAREYVDMVRGRAAKPAGWVKKYVDDADPSKGVTNIPAANYKIGLYVDVVGTPADGFSSKVSAKKAIQFERKLELGMEGHRFFDLVRWGIAEQEINNYLAGDATKRIHLVGAKFNKDRDEHMPIPESVINQSFKGGTATLKQNIGY